jgi:tRNA A-37 threonylcarbamoyl transferase component Bud32
MPEEKAAAHPRIGTRIGGRFVVESFLGSGGMGEVFAARHALTGRRVALKVVRTDAQKPDRTARFLREAQIAAALRHPNIVEILDAFEDEDRTPVLVMELLAGESLSARRARSGLLGLQQASAILVPVAQALRAAHQKGVVHRDLKPENIFLADSGSRDAEPPVPKLLDFGIAKVVDGGELAIAMAGASTNTGAIVGTPHYMAFEQAMSERAIDGRADIWSLGVILFELLAGRRPIEFQTLGQMYAAFLQGSIVPARDTMPQLPPEVADLLDRCLVINRTERLADLEPFVRILGPYADGKPAALVGTTPAVHAEALSHTVHPRAPGQPRGRAWLTGAGAAILVAAASWWITLQARSQTRPANATNERPVVSALSALADPKQAPDEGVTESALSVAASAAPVTVPLPRLSAAPAVAPTEPPRAPVHAAVAPRPHATVVTPPAPRENRDAPASALPPASAATASTAQAPKRSIFETPPY